MTDEQKSDFKEKLGRDLKMAKGLLFREEARSALLALMFGLNVACVVALPFSLFSLVNIFAVYWVAQRFKSTVKSQIMYKETLNLLKKLKDEKVWTKSD